jgi:xanthine/CO dehydrogenase XdhC/CoxF family maturation factor
MHLGVPALLEYFRSRRESDESLVVATIVGTEGSTYRKPGAMMLVGEDGSFEGLISGGCLEGDLLEHAAEVLGGGAPKHVTYDMHADDELVWSLGLGCDGVIHLLLQRLDQADGFGFLGGLERARRERRAVLLGLVTEAGGSLPVGAWALRDSSDISDGAPELGEALGGLAKAWPDWRCRELEVEGQAPARMLVVHVPPAPRVLICGAGPDAVPLARLLAELDWDVVLADHRPAYVRADRFPTHCEVVCVRPERLAEQVELQEVKAAVVMSHHLENDAAYLAQLGSSELEYLGVLGPLARRRRLAVMTGIPEERLFGPVGLDIGAELPASIALAVAAEIHAVLNGRQGESLTRINK